MNRGLRIIPQVSYVANVFHFISNLAGWHFSNRSAYKEFWLRETGKFTKNEKGALNRASKLFNKYTFGTPKHWGNVFLTEQNRTVWEKGEKEYPRTDFEEFRNVYTIFEPRFSKLWKVDEKLLARWIEKFRELGEKISPPSLASDLDTLFGTKKDIREVKVILLVNSPNYNGGGGFLRPGYITLELSRTPLHEVRNLVLVMWHEMIHNIWQDKTYWEMIKDYTEKLSTYGVSSTPDEIPPTVLINEAVTESLLPRGLLAKKYFGFVGKGYLGKDKMSLWRDYSVRKLIPLAEKYIDQKRKIDHQFLDRTLDLLTKFAIIK